MAGTTVGCSSLFSKTKFCKFFAKGKCSKGSDCVFAHHFGELQALPDFSKTRICKKFKNGMCDDANCSYAHTKAELRKNVKVSPKVMEENKAKPPPHRMEWHKLKSNPADESNGRYTCTASLNTNEKPACAIGQTGLLPCASALKVVESRCTAPACLNIVEKPMDTIEQIGPITHSSIAACLKQPMVVSSGLMKFMLLPVPVIDGPDGPQEMQSTPVLTPLSPVSTRISETMHSFEGSSYGSEQGSEDLSSLSEIPFQFQPEAPVPPKLNPQNDILIANRPFSWEDTQMHNKKDSLDDASQSRASNGMKTMVQAPFMEFGNQHMPWPDATAERSRQCLCGTTFIPHATFFMNCGGKRKQQGDAEPKARCRMPSLRNLIDMHNGGALIMDGIAPRMPENDYKMQEMVKQCKMSEQPPDEQFKEVTEQEDQELLLQTVKNTFLHFTPYPPCKSSLRRSSSAPF